MDAQQLKAFLDKKAAEYNRPLFIKTDPVQVPHRFSKKEDIEISGLFAALFAWGNRTTIINKANELMALLDDAPHQFVTQHKETDLKRLLHFKHRTFNATDLLYFIAFLNQHYLHHQSLEEAFTPPEGPLHVEAGLNYFHQYFFSFPDAPARTKKHVAAPYKGSTCKRLNMFLRWMVRDDACGVDFGIWKKFSPAQLILPIDLHVARVARRFGLLQRPAIDWKAAVELTQNLRAFNCQDPALYDFALFGLGAEERF